MKHKTIAEVASDLNKSKTSVYNLLKKNENELRNHVHKRQGKTFLDDYAEQFLVNYYASETLETLKDIGISDAHEPSVSTTFNDFQSNSTRVESSSNLLNVIQLLQKQLQVKDNQIKDLTEGLKNISLAFAEREKSKQQELYLQAVDKKDLFVNTPSSPPSERDGLLRRFFKRAGKK